MAAILSRRRLRVSHVLGDARARHTQTQRNAAQRGGGDGGGSGGDDEAEKNARIEPKRRIFCVNSDWPPSRARARACTLAVCRLLVKCIFSLCGRRKMVVASEQNVCFLSDFTSELQQEAR